MVSVAAVRTQIQNKIFTPYGKSVTLKTVGTPTYNARGEILDADFTDTAITVIPYNVMFDQESYEPFGDLGIGEVDMAVLYSQTISVGDRIVMDSETWEVKNTQKNYLPDNLVTIIRVEKVSGEESA